VAGVVGGVFGANVKTIFVESVESKATVLMFFAALKALTSALAGDSVNFLRIAAARPVGVVVPGLVAVAAT
jgi:hypothetical protein